MKFRLPDKVMTNVAMQMRLRDIGLKFDTKTGEIDEASLHNVAGGPGAVKQAAGKDGVLDYFETMQLRKNVDFMSTHKEDVRAIHINARVAGLQMEADHCAGLLEALLSQMYTGNRIDVSTVKVAAQSAQRFDTRRNEYAQVNGDLGLADAANVAGLEGALGGLAKACARMTYVLSDCRTQLLNDRANLYGRRLELYGACDAALGWINAMAQFATTNARDV